MPCHPFLLISWLDPYINQNSQAASLTQVFHSSLKYAASTTGDHMFMLEVAAKNNDELRDFSDRLKMIEGVTRICPAIIKDTLKGTL